MAERFQPYHVPQQSRRDKLRVTSQIQLENVQESSNLVPIYDPSIISSDLINCAKEKGINLMGSSSSSSSPTNHLYLDPQSSVQINPSSVEDINGGQYIYNTVPPQCLRVIDQSFPLSTSAATCQGLSLSLSSHHTHQNNLPLELNLQQRYDSSLFSSFAAAEGGAASGGGGGGGGGGPSCNELSRSSVPLGPFTGYASILKGSRFLKPAQQLLEEICYVGRGIYEETISSESLDLPPLESFNGEDDDPLSNCSDGGEQSGKKSRLLSMLHEVYRRYKHYYQQMQSVVASFESVAGLSHAAPFANLALKAMSKHFRCLRNVITDQLQCLKSNGPLSYERDAVQFGNSGGGSQSQRPFHNAGFVDQPVWRPQRGLPERAVTVLRAWLFEHFLHPYPTDTDKIRLAKQTGLTRNQVSNWFINARVRLWKPMVEEIHMLETRQAQKPSQQGEHSSNRQNDNLPTSRPVESENPSTSMQRIENLPSTEAPLVPYENLSRQLGMGMSSGGTGGPSGGVSLTLGLHQNVGFSEAYPVNAARRFGLDVQGEGYVSSGFGGQNRQFGRDIIGGQLLHDFVG